MYMKLSRPVFTVSVNMATTTIPTATSATVLAAVPAGASQLQAYNGGSKPISLFAGKAGVTQIPVTLAPGQSSPMLSLDGQVGFGDVIKAKAQDVDVTAGYLVLNFFG